MLEAQAAALASAIQREVEREGVQRLRGTLFTCMLLTETEPLFLHSVLGRPPTDVRDEDK